MFDRCIMCRGPLKFYGISIKPEWVKWMECPHDATFFGATEFGTLVAQVKRIPENAYFVQFRDKKD